MPADPGALVSTIAALAPSSYAIAAARMLASEPSVPTSDCNAVSPPAHAQDATRPVDHTPTARPDSLSASARTAFDGCAAPGAIASRAAGAAERCTADASAEPKPRRRNSLSSSSATRSDESGAAIFFELAPMDEIDGARRTFAESQDPQWALFLVAD